MLLFSSVLILLSRKQTRQGYVPPVLFIAECDKWIDLFVGDMWKVVYRFYLLLRFFYSIFGGVRAVHHFSFLFFFFFFCCVCLHCVSSAQCCPFMIAPSYFCDVYCYMSMVALSSDRLVCQLADENNWLIKNCQLYLIHLEYS